MIDIELIKKTFTVDEEYPSGVSCLLSIMKFYNINPQIYLPKYKNREEYFSLGDLKKEAISNGFQTEIKLMEVNQLKEIKHPIILFSENEYEKPVFVICYGFWDERFIIGDTIFGIMQYFPEETAKMWIHGICLDLYPNTEYPE